MKYIFFMLLMIALVSCDFITTTTKEPETKRETAVSTSFRSLHMQEDVDYHLILPTQYESKKDSLSLLVLLDGDDYTGIAENATSLYESAGEIFPTVILSLPSTQKSRWTYYTPTRDSVTVEPGFEDLYALTGKFQEFGDFLKEELIPSIEEEYGIRFKQKTIFGHSLGGLGVLSFAVLKPDVFDHYISASPSTMFDDHYIFKTLEKKGELPFKAMYITSAVKEPNGYKENVEWLYGYLRENQNEGQSVGMEIYEEESHMTSGLKSLLDGIRFIGKKRYDKEAYE